MCLYISLRLRTQVLSRSSACHLSCRFYTPCNRTLPSHITYFVDYNMGFKQHDALVDARLGMGMLRMHVLTAKTPPGAHLIQVKWSQY